MRPLWVFLAWSILVMLLGSQALVLWGPRGLGLTGPGSPQAGVTAPTLLRLVSPGARRPAAPQLLPATRQVSPPPGPASPPPQLASNKPSSKPAAAPARTYTVGAGDTLWEIARQFGVEVDALASANRGVDPGDLQVGQVLAIPSGPAAVPAPLEPATGTIANAFTWPALAPISSLFGPRWGGYHTGIDLAVASGTPVRAARAGKVALAESLGGYGLAVILDHPDGTKTLYAHNSRLLVGKGDNVRQTDVIARSGNTGNSTGPHLHFEIIVGGRPRNPLDYLPDVGLAVQENR